jgi:hypothetical protein
MDFWILDDTVRVRVYYEKEDCRFEDNICISFFESCPEDEKIFRADETNIFLTPEQARKLCMALQKASGSRLDHNQELKP